jgi:predicted DNA-binding protein with PD1-like motif
MNYAQAAMGRIFVVRLIQNEVVHECIEQFAVDQSIGLAMVIALGGADKGSKLVVGPEDGSARPVVPMDHLVDNVHEIAGVGTIAPDASGKPLLHMHAAMGRGATALCGCVRRGVVTWQVMEIVIIEMINDTTQRVMEKETGFELLRP